MIRSLGLSTAASIILLATLSYWFLEPGTVDNNSQATSHPPVTAAHTQTPDLAVDLAALVLVVSSLEKKLDVQSARVDQLLAELNGRIDILAEHTRAQPSRAPTLDSMDASLPGAVLSEVELQQQIIEYNRQQYRLLDNTLNSEVEDVAWSIESGGRFDQAFTVTGDYFSLGALDCSSTMCRMQANLIKTPQHGVMNAASQMQALLVDTIGWEGETITQVNTESGQVVAYLMREGVPLPQIAEHHGGQPQ